MKCESCYKNQTDYATVNDKRICKSCADSQNLTVCPNCGKFYEFGTSSGNFCYKCENELD